METKKKIYVKASKMFLDKGYENTPMSHIAKEMGLSKAGLFHHYASKESLLFDVIEYLNEKNFAPIYEDAVKIPDPEQRLLFFLRKFIEIMTIDPSFRIAVHEANKLKPHHLKKVKKNWQKAHGLIKDAISEMQSIGKFKEINSAFAAFAAIGMCCWTFYWFDYSRKDSSEELVESFIEIFMGGICKAPHSCPSGDPVSLDVEVKGVLM